MDQQCVWDPGIGSNVCEILHRTSGLEYGSMDGRRTIDFPIMNIYYNVRIITD